MISIFLPITHLIQGFQVHKERIREDIIPFRILLFRILPLFPFIHFHFSFNFNFNFNLSFVLLQLLALINFRLSLNLHLLIYYLIQIYSLPPNPPRILPKKYHLNSNILYYHKCFFSFLI